LEHATEESSWRRDRTPHKIQFVTVEDNVKLEVVDWGGSGRWPGQNPIGSSLRLGTDGQFHRKSEILPDAAISLPARPMPKSNAPLHQDSEAAGRWTWRLTGIWNQCYSEDRLAEWQSGQTTKHLSCLGVLFMFAEKMMAMRAEACVELSCRRYL
jgi:hypothetical protein